MNPMDVGPVSERPVRQRRVPPALIAWLAGIAAIILLDVIDGFLDRYEIDGSILGFFAFFAWLLVIGLTLYGLAVFTRWVLRQLFWTVGRRLFLSYLLVGVLPFILMTILLLT